MPRCYEQLSRVEREYIALSHRLGSGRGEIGAVLRRHRSTIYRELKRNSEGPGRYYGADAHRRALGRRAKARRPRKLGSAALRASVERGLRLYWSPEQISGRRKQRGRAGVSRMTIYRHVAAQGEKWQGYLRGPPRREGPKAERIHARVMIDERPAIVERRDRVGDWESDTVRGPMTSKACVATHVERKSYYLVARLLKECTGEEMNRQTSEGLAGLPVHTLTVDNGMEFASFKRLEQALGARVYFAREKCPWQRARNEYTNRLLRQFWPRGTDFSALDPAEIRRVERLPRKALGFRTPKEAMRQLGVALVS